jgi:hypothetical protein
MLINTVGNKADTISIVVKNSGTATIPAGSPVYFTFNGTDDGTSVIDATAAGAAKYQTFAGVLPADVVPNSMSNAVVFGFMNAAKVIRQTRSATSVDYAATTIAIGDILVVDTANKCFVRNGAGATATAQGYAIAAQALSVVSVASTTNDTSTSKLGTMKIFLRAL